MTENNFWTSEQRLLTAEETFSFNESDEKDIMLSLQQAQILVICLKKRCRKRGTDRDAF
jgi:hypothetical protein